MTMLDLLALLGLLSLLANCYSWPGLLELLIVPKWS